jgi:hypothetical protein
MHRAPLLVIVGHSFGGMIVYSALAQSLIEAASTNKPHISTRFADLVLLVNPGLGSRAVSFEDRERTCNLRAATVHPDI